MHTLSVIFLFASPTPVSLFDALRLAQAYNEQALLADVAVQRAEAQTQRALGSYLPRATLNGTTRHLQQLGEQRSIVGPVPMYSSGSYADVQVEQTVLNVPAVYAYLKAIHRERAAVYERQAKLVDIMLQTADKYLDVDALATKKRIESQRAQRAEAQRVLVQRRVEAEVSSPNEVWVAEQELAEALAAQAQLDRRLRRAEAELAQLVGQAVPATELPADLLTAACDPLAEVEVLIDTALAQRADVRALASQQVAAQHSESEAQTRLLPVLQAQSSAALPMGGAPVWSIAATLRWELFVADTWLSEPQLRAADRHDAAIRANALRRAVHNKVRSAHGIVLALCAAQEQHLRAEAAGGKRYAYVQERYARGLEDVTNVKLAADDWARTESARVQVQHDLGLAHLALQAELGIILSDEPAAVAP